MVSLKSLDKLIKENNRENSVIFANEVGNTVHDIFSEATSHKEFGNGRFARNLLEQTIMKQSARLTAYANIAGSGSDASRPLRRQELITLLSEDIAVESVKNYKVEKPSIGFR